MIEHRYTHTHIYIIERKGSGDVRRSNMRTIGRLRKVKAANSNIYDIHPRLKKKKEEEEEDYTLSRPMQFRVALYYTLLASSTIVSIYAEICISQFTFCAS